MIEQVVEAFDRQDYRTAAKLLKGLIKESPDNPWVQFYIGRLHEVSGKLNLAEGVYRKLLRDAINPKIMGQARQGLQRLESIEKEKRQQAIAEATTDPDSHKPGFLILEPVPAEARQKAAQSFAQIMKIDPYTARLQLPSRGWQLYRTGPIGELRVYAQELQAAEISAFCASLTDVQAVKVLRVSYLQAIAPQAVVVCQNEQGQIGSLTFEWSEVAQRVEGLLPIFEDVVDQGPWGKLQRKEQTQDYAQVCDLHLPGRQCLLRFCDSTYQFQEGVALDSAQDNQQSLQTTTRINWNNLLTLIREQLPETPVWSNFTAFAETTQVFADLVGRVESHIDLFRKADTYWDSAFQLYSALVLLKNAT